MDVPEHGGQPSDASDKGYVYYYYVYCVYFIANLSIAEECDNTPMLPMEKASHNVFRNN